MFQVFIVEHWQKPGDPQSDITWCPGIHLSQSRVTKRDRDMLNLFEVLSLIVFTVVGIIAILGNGFIIAVNSHSWLRSRKMVPCEVLLTTLSIFRLLVQWAAMMNQFLYFSSPKTYLYSYTMDIFTFCWTYSNMASLWCTAWLNVFYCMKVATFVHPVFLWLRPRICKFVPVFLGLSLAAFTMSSLPSVVRYCIEKKDRSVMVNGSQCSFCHGDNPYVFLFPYQASFIAISFSLCLTATFLLLASLWRHIEHLKQSGAALKDFSTQVHIRVIKLLGCSLFFYILHFAAIIIAIGNYAPFGKPERLFCDIILALYPSIHSIILIWTNPKLKKASTRILNIRRRAP